MSTHAGRPLRRLAMITAVAAAVATSMTCALGASAAGVTLPAPHAGFDYQIGGSYTPPQGVSVVSRPHEESPAAGLYNICYVNAFQTQPGAVGSWDSDLLLHDADGDVVYDDKWAGEAILDLRTADRRERIAAKVGGWIDECADKGFQAVEPDNYDTFTRFPDYLSADDAKAYIELLSAHAHRRGLAVAQKNTLELAGEHEDAGLDFAVVEECGRWKECGDFVDAFGDHVVVIEYTAQGLATACDGWGDRLSVVRRDENVSPSGSDAYVRETC